MMKTYTRKTFCKGSAVVLLAMLVVFLPTHSESATTKKKNKAHNRSKSRTAQVSQESSEESGKSKTVADILKKIEKKSQQVNFQKRDSSLPSAGPLPTVEASKVNLQQVKPPTSNRLYFEEGTDEAELEKVLDEGVDQLYKLSNQYKKSTKRGELWLRLAELYVDKARLIEFRLLNQHDKNLQMFAAGKLKSRPRLDLKPAQAYNLKAITLYEWFIRDFPKDPKMDQALYFLGFNYFELNEPKKGESYYLRLTKEYPNSLYVNEANFAVGEYYFENEKWKQALEYYEKVATQRNYRLYSFAMYKIAWCQYKLNNPPKALTFLEQVIFEGRRTKGSKDSSTGGVSRIRLASEAVKDLIVFYAEAGAPEKARPYFTKVIGEKSTNANLAKLAYFYMDTGNRDGATLIFRDLISQDSNAVKAYDYQYAIVKMYGAAGGSPTFKKELYMWIEQYGPESSWQKINSEDAQAITKANELMESTLRNHVLQQHQVAQNAKTKSARAGASQGYELYFQTFKKTTRLEEMHFFYGELLFDIADYKKAAFHYTWVLENTPEGQYYDRALLNALLAYEKRLPNDAKIKTIVGERTEPIEFDDVIKDFEGAAYRFLEKSPKSDNVVGVKYRLGALYYLFNQFDPALKMLNEIVRKYPKSQYATFAANHILDIYNLKKDYVGLQKAANEILAVPELARSEVGAQIKDIKLRTDFKLAKELEDKKDYAGSAAAYEDFAMKNRASSLATGALFNAAVNYERSGGLIKAIGLYGLVVSNKTKGDEGLKSQSAKFMPVLYEKTGQYEKAAFLFEDYARKKPSDKEALGYHYNAAVIYDGLNSYAAAIRNYEVYLQKAKSSDRFEILFLLGKMFERREMYDRAIGYYNQYINSGSVNASGLVEASYLIATLHEKLARTKVKVEWQQKTVLMQRRFVEQGKKVGVGFAAEMKFKLNYKYYEDLLAIRIPKNPAAQGAAIKDKLAAMNRLKNKLKEVIAYDDGYQIVAALTTQGKALEHLYNSIISAPVPAGLNPDELKQYKAGVEKIAKPFRDQAIETYSAAVSRGHELQGYNDFLKVAYVQLHQLKGDEVANRNVKVILTQLADSMDN